MTEEAPDETDRSHSDRTIGNSVDDRQPVIYPLVADRGNRRVLEDWLENQDSYRVADSDRPFPESEFDLCVVDEDGLLNHTAALERARADAAPVLLPVLLLLSEQRSGVIDADAGTITDNVFETTVDEILSMPIRQVELDWRFRALLRLRGQSIELKGQADKLTRFQKAVEASGHAIFMTDPDGTIWYANDAFEDVTGYSPSSVIGETPRVLSSGKMPDAYFSNLWSTIRAGDVWEEQVVNRRKDGVEYTAHQTIAPITENGDDIQAFVAIQTDVTDLENRTQQLGVIDTILRHNLRNYLTSIRGTAELIADEAPENIAALAEQIVSDADDLLETGEKSRAITDILSSDQAVKDIDLQRAATSAINTVSTEHPDVQIDADLADGLEVTATDNVEDAITELLRNAIRHNDRDDPHIAVCGWTDEETVLLSVSDNGPGLMEMDRDVLENGTALDDLHHGSGLGLWLVYWIVNRSGGTIDVETIEPRGTRVTLELPRRKTEAV